MSCWSLFRSNGRRSLSETKSVLSDVTLLDDCTATAKYDDKAAVRFDNKTDTTDRLAALRGLMEEEGVDAYLVPSEDAHGSEYSSTSEHRRQFISGFTGDVGTAIILRDSAHLFVDGRFYIQAEHQLDDNWTLHKVGLVPDWTVWLPDEVRKYDKGFAIGVDPTLVSYAIANRLLADLVPIEATLAYPSRNLVDVVWGDARPAPSTSPVNVHPLQFAGRNANEKLNDVTAWLKRGGDDKRKPIPRGSALVLSQLDEIAWLFNLRGASMSNSPLFPSYAVVRPDEEGYKAVLFISSLLLPKNRPAYPYVVNDLHVEVQEYDRVFEYLITGAWKGPGDLQQIVVTDQASWAVVNAVGTPNVYQINRALSPVVIAKAIKNEVEVQGMRNAYLRDGVCWARWASWLDEAVRVKGEKIDEWEAAEVLINERKKAEHYAGMEAYDPISATGQNAALPHYQTPEHGAPYISTHTPYLMDSGGQYYDGTIDTTRTVHFGKPTKAQQRAFTRVLQGHIAIDTSVFPRYRTTGAALDVRARAPLWHDGYSYQHGTGHGIGSFLGVHEGPQGFSSSSGGSPVPVVLQPNMCISNEPGFYKEGDFGIRTESIVVVRVAKTHYADGGKDAWLAFERLTVVPIDTKLIDFSLLNKDEAAWVKAHNEECKRKLLPLLRDDKRAQKWLKRH